MEQGQNSLNHLEKIIKKKAKALFLKGHKDRNVPTYVIFLFFFLFIILVIVVPVEFQRFLMSSKI